MSRTLKLKLVLILIFFSGALWAFGLRFVLVNQEVTHYHADFAIYVDGQRDMLEDFTFYEELTACSPESANDPGSRIHLHDQEPGSIHVHDKAASWGHLFDNLGYTLGRDFMKTKAGLLTETSDKKLTFILNGKEISFVNDRVVGDTDTLLVSYGSEPTDVLLERYNSIPQTAEFYNGQDDPAACAGPSSESIGARIRRTIGI